MIKLNFSSNHTYHETSNSPWPVIISICLLNLTISISYFMHSSQSIYLKINLLTLIIITIQWWRDVVRESTFQGMHTYAIMKGLKMGMIFFIISEIMFFFSFFWSLFNFMLSMNIDLGLSWPPLNIKPFNPFNIPLLNSLILISSGITITWSHMSLINKNKFNSILSLSITIVLGSIFTFLQFIEYKSSFFSMYDSTYGSLFFLMTGFHGIHVIIGTIFLIISFSRMTLNHFSSIHHFGFESASWYWHFVDVVWLFLYISVYWWSM